MNNIRRMAIDSGDPASFYKSLGNLDQYKNSDYMNGILADLYPQGQPKKSVYDGLDIMGAFKGFGQDVGNWWNGSPAQKQPAATPSGYAAPPSQLGTYRSGENAFAQNSSPIPPFPAVNRQVTDPMYANSQEGIAAGLNLSNVGGASPNMMGEELGYGVNPTITSDLYQNPFDYQAEPMPTLNTGAGTTAAMPSANPTVPTVPDTTMPDPNSAFQMVTIPDNPNNSTLDRTHLDESSMFGDIGDAWGEMQAVDQFKIGAGVAMAGLQGWNAWQANEIAEDKLDFQMDAFNKNYNMQKTAYNDNIQARNRTLSSATGSDQYAHNKV